MLKNSTIGFIGGGNMAEALIKGMLNGGIAADNISVAEPLAERREYLSQTYQVKTVEENSAVATAQLLVLAVKPQMAASAMSSLDGSVNADKLVISIMAGVSTITIEESMRNVVRIIRAMPNTPALVQSGATAICAGRRAEKADLQMAQELFATVGSVVTITEQQMDAVTGLSGSGPAYAFSFMEALTDAGVKNGLSRDTASKLAVQTLLGAAKLVQESGLHPAQLRDQVTSPGGTTIAALHTLEKGCFHGLIMDAVDTAVKRSGELSGIKLQ